MNVRIYPIHYRWLLLFYAVMLNVVPSCSTLNQTRPANDLVKAYSNAVNDAANPEPVEISRRLTAIVDHNENLLWQDEPGKSRVLVLTWSSYEGYDTKVGQPVVVPEIWVTVAPELKDFCRGRDLPFDELTLRFEQLLGLPPFSGKNRFVEMWVNPGDLFRPCPDNEITDTSCGLNIPENVLPSYREWFNLKRAASYGKCDRPEKQAYPWTQLGYTYDWGNPKSEVGLSEFVVRKKSTVVINSVSTLQAYCR